MRISDWSSDVCSSDLSIMGALYKGFWTTAVLSIPAIYGAMIWGLGNLDAPVPGGGFTGMDLFWCAMVGLAVTGLLVWITEYYTGTNFRPVRSIAKASETGHGTNVDRKSTRLNSSH